MAAALLAARMVGAVTASAGLSPDDAVDPFAIGTLLEEGQDISAHTPTLVSPEAIDAETIVIALTQGAFAHAREWRKQGGFELEYWDLPDVPTHDGPRDMVADGYRAIREALKAHIRNRFGS